MEHKYNELLDTLHNITTTHKELLTTYTSIISSNTKLAPTNDELTTHNNQLTTKNNQLSATLHQLIDDMGKKEQNISKYIKYSKELMKENVSLLDKYNVLVKNKDRYHLLLDLLTYVCMCVYMYMSM